MRPGLTHSLRWPRHPTPCRARSVSVSLGSPHLLTTLSDEQCLTGQPYPWAKPSEQPQVAHVWGAVEMPSNLPATRSSTPGRAPEQQSGLPVACSTARPPPRGGPVPPSPMCPSPGPRPEGAWE